MKILILGMDGYLGWSLANYLREEDGELHGMDSLFRRKWVREMGSVSAVPISSVEKRLHVFKEWNKREISFYKGDVTNYDSLSERMKAIRPDVVVHFAQCPSAPYSMMSREKCAWVQKNNLVGTLNLIYSVKEHAPEAHIVKLGTMGEYGTPNIDIPEGFFEIEYKGRKDKLPFPRQANSWYHLSKVHDSNNLQFACRNFGLRCTDIMQGVVFGHRFSMTDGTAPELQTRLDFDQAFGTVINRFCCEAVIHHAITVYGDGTQTRSFLPLRDSMECIRLVIKNPPSTGEYKVINQFANIHSINDLAAKVAGVSDSLGLRVEVVKMANPRKEATNHYYHPDNSNLKALGYHPSTDFGAEILELLKVIEPFKKRILKYGHVLKPTIKW